MSIDRPAVLGGSVVHAKLNLALAVTGRGPDGYHELRSVVVRVGLVDQVLGTRIEGPGDRLVVEGDPDCPIEGNIVLRALTALRAHEADVSLDDRPLPWLEVWLQKGIPMGAGLGGGSADAAAALHLLGSSALDAALAADPGLPARLGADVPFFLSQAWAALVSGLGERVEPVPPLRPPHGFLLAMPSLALSTAAVFAAHDALGPRGSRSEPVVMALAEALRGGLDGPGLVAWAGRLRDANDLWRAAAAVAPGLTALRDALEGRLRRPVLMTGSGSTLFAIYPSRDEAEASAATLEAELSLDHPGLRVVAVDDDIRPDQ